MADDRRMKAASRPQRRYDHRLRDLVRRTGAEFNSDGFWRWSGHDTPWPSTSRRVAKVQVEPTQHPAHLVGRHQISRLGSPTEFRCTPLRGLVRLIDTLLIVAAQNKLCDT